METEAQTPPLRASTIFVGIFLLFAIGCIALFSDHDSGTAFVFMGLAGTGVYFAPTIAAATRKHPRLMSIGLLNLFLGWTLVGWVAALVWAYATDQDNAGSRHCPFCAETVLAAARKCKHCGSALTVA